MEIKPEWQITEAQKREMKISDAELEEAWEEAEITPLEVYQYKKYYRGE